MPMASLLSVARILVMIARTRTLMRDDAIGAAAVP